MKKIFLALLLICFIFSACGKKEVTNDDYNKILQRDKLIVGVRDDAPPFGFKDKDGNFAGYDVDLAKIIAYGILGDENKIEFVPVTASNRIMKLSAGEADMLIAAMSITNQRQQILDFSAPYYIAGQAILVKSSSKATSLKDFEGGKLIIVFGSTSEKSLRRNVPGVNIIGYKNYTDAYNALKAGKADGIVADDSILLSFAIKDKAVKLLPKRYSKEPYAIAFRKDEDSQRLQKKVNYIIQDLQGRRRLEQLQKKWQIK